MMNNSDVMTTATVAATAEIMTVPTKSPMTSTTTVDNIFSKYNMTISSSTCSSNSSDNVTNITNNTNDNKDVAADRGAAATVAATFSEQVNTVTNLFDKWNDCERTVVMYALLKRLHYPSLKFLQHTIDNQLTLDFSFIILDINANNVSYMQNLLNAYKNFHLNFGTGSCSSGSAGGGGVSRANGGIVDNALLSSSSSSSSSLDKESLTKFYGNDLQLAQTDIRKMYDKKEDILNAVLTLLPLLKPCNEEAKQIFLAFMPLTVEDTLCHIVPADLVQQIFSYMLIHPAITVDDRRSLNVWLQQLEYHSHYPAGDGSRQQSYSSFFTNNHGPLSSSSNINVIGAGAAGLITELPQRFSSDSSSAISTSSSSLGSSFLNTTSNILTTTNCCSNTADTNVDGSSSSASSSVGQQRNIDWQTIAPPSKMQSKTQVKQSDWSSGLIPPPPPPSLYAPNHGMGSCVDDVVGVGAVIGSNALVVNQFCDNFNGIALNELASSQNNLRLSMGGSNSSDCLSLTSDTSSAAATAASAVASVFGRTTTNPIINIISGGNNNDLADSSNSNTGVNSHQSGDDYDTSFSKNGTEIFDFEPISTINSNRNMLNVCDNCNNNIVHTNCQMQQQQQPEQLDYASILMRNYYDHSDMVNGYSLDSKLCALKTRRSNSLTTQTLSSTSSISSNSSVLTVSNDNCSNSTENLAQFANKPRSFSLSIEHHRGGVGNGVSGGVGALMNGGGSDTRLDEFKPNYIKFQTRNIGMSGIGLWLKSLRLHKYIDLFKEMTYEEMLGISEEYLQSLGVTKGASHKLALCIEKLKERSEHLQKIEQSLLSGQIKVQTAVEELANMVLTPMKPVEVVAENSPEANIGMYFLKVIDLVCSIISKDVYVSQDDESINIILWILDRSIHNEAFINHASQLKELKLKLSKLKMVMGPLKLHHGKNGSNGNLNKPRWNSKSRKSDSKNGSNDRINQRKNSSDMVNYGMNNLQQQQQQQQQSQSQHYGGHHLHQQQQQKQSSSDHCSSNNNNNNNKQQQQQSQLPQHRRSLNNLILISGGPQQPQKMIFKPGHGIMPSSTESPTTTTTSAENLQMMENSLQQQQQQHHTYPSKRKASFSGLSSLAPPFTPSSFCGSSIIANTTTNASVTQLQRPKNSMTTMVLVSNNKNNNNNNNNNSHCHIDDDDDENARAVASHIIKNNNCNNSLVEDQTVMSTNNHMNNNNNYIKNYINNNNNNNDCNMLNNNLISQQQQQQQLQLLAVAAAAVGSNCCDVVANNNQTNNDRIANCININNNNNSSNNINNNIDSSQYSSNGISNINDYSNGNNCCCSVNCDCNFSANSLMDTTLQHPSSSHQHYIANIVTQIPANAVPLTIAPLPQPSTAAVQQQQKQQQQPQLASTIVNAANVVNCNNSNNNNANVSSTTIITNTTTTTTDDGATTTNNMNDIKSLEQLETLCLQMTEQAIN